ncbi:hypothetical protein [Natrinema sp. SYSU A 869]|uniref:hypothetical protein n=1 Tax=Natrinema sp. SYSU A 869 TaxID=2871694 RepID=UPI001CA414FF|nr:hypothetical protein [Natrinema sp. SYSU A 869]
MEDNDAELDKLIDEIDETIAGNSSSSEDATAQTEYDENWIETGDIVGESDTVRAELLAYDGTFDVSEVGGNMNSKRRTVVYLAIENKTDEQLRIYDDEFALIGQDDFVYEYAESPRRELPSGILPPHYKFSNGWTDIPSGSKVRYLILSEPLPDETEIRSINYDNNHEFTLSIPADAPRVIGDPPM